MAKLSARGRTMVYQSESFTFRERIMSDGVVLRNYGSGWKTHGKVKAGLTPQAAGDFLAGKIRELDQKRPARAAYLAELLEVTNLETRGHIHTLVSMLPDDPDAVYSEAHDFVRAEIDLDDALRLCDLYRAMVAEKKAAREAQAAIEKATGEPCPAGQQS